MKQGIYRTPGNFMARVRAEFPLAFDLAASMENAQAPDFYTAEDDALTKTWRGARGWLWLNPPFRNILPWARRCWDESRKDAQILFLVPAAVGSDWYADWLHDKAEIRFLRGRLAFEFTYPEDYQDADGNPSKKAGKMNTDPYPKDLLLALYEKGRKPKTFPWDWRGIHKGAA